MRHFDITFFLLLAGSEITLLFLYMYCYHGKIATDSLLAYSDCIYNCDWYRYPDAIQKMFIIMIAYGQRQQFYNGFGILNLKLETFTAVFIGFLSLDKLLIIFFSF